MTPILEATQIAARAIRMATLGRAGYITAPLDTGPAHASRLRVNGVFNRNLYIEQTGYTRLLGPLRDFIDNPTSIGPHLQVQNLPSIDYDVTNAGVFYVRDVLSNMTTIAVANKAKVNATINGTRYQVALNTDFENVQRDLREQWQREIAEFYESDEFREHEAAMHKNQKAIENARKQPLPSFDTKDPQGWAQFLAESSQNPEMQDLIRYAVTLANKLKEKMHDLELSHSGPLATKLQQVFNTADREVNIYDTSAMYRHEAVKILTQYWTWGDDLRYAYNWNCVGYGTAALFKAQEAQDQKGLISPNIVLL